MFESCCFIQFWPQSTSTELFWKDQIFPTGFSHIGFKASNMIFFSEQPHFIERNISQALEHFSAFIPDTCFDPKVPGMPEKILMYGYSIVGSSSIRKIVLRCKIFLNDWFNFIILTVSIS